MYYLYNTANISPEPMKTIVKITIDIFICVLYYCIISVIQGEDKMHWSFSPDIPIYIQIIEQLEQMIVSGMLSPGDRLLSVREFAAEAGVNPNTMQKALTELEKKGVVSSQRTLGRFVTDDPMKLSELREGLAQKEITSFLGAMKRLGYTRSEVVALLNENKDAALRQTEKGADL